VLGYTAIMNIILLDSKHWPSVYERGVEKHEVQKTAEDAAREVVQLIPFMPSYVNLVVYPSVADDVILETGTMGMTYSDEYASVYFDHSIPYGKEELLDSIRTTVYHELVHAATFQFEGWQPSVLFGAVTEGLATVFERNYADEKPLWGNYEDDKTMQKWLQELKDLPGIGQKNNDYFFKHVDGRRWIVYKTGTWIVDKLLESGEDLFELMKLDHKDVMAKLESLQE